MMRATMFCACLLLATAAEAQWAKQRDPRVPVSRNGTPNLDAPAPRAAGGKPDLSGVWKTDGEPVPEFVTLVEGAYPQGLQAPHRRDGGHETREPADGAVAEALLKERMQDPTVHPGWSCKPTGEPASAEAPFPFKIVQTPRLILVLYEENTEFRQIFLDGREVSRTPSRPTTDINGRWRRHPGGGNVRVRRQDLPRHLGAPAHRGDAHDGAFRRLSVGSWRSSLPSPTRRPTGPRSSTRGERR